MGDLMEERDFEIPTLLEPSGYGASTCGYCGPPGERSEDETSKSYGMSSPQMSPRVYQQLIDRGWRRSGTYVYHPDNANTCCAQITIRLDALQFNPGKDKKMRYVLNRWKRFVLEGDRAGAGAQGQDVKTKVEGDSSRIGAKTTAIAGQSESAGDVSEPSSRSEQSRMEGGSSKTAKGKGKERVMDGGEVGEIRSPANAAEKNSDHPMNGLSKKQRKKLSKEQQGLESSRDPEKGQGKGKGKENKQEKAYDYLGELHAPESSRAGSSAGHRYEVQLVKAKATEEVFALYDRYQQSIHGDEEGKNSLKSFSRFLCENPLGYEKIKYKKERKADDGLPDCYGCYHQLHRINGKLIAFSVIDILPGCVSSVYFVWDPNYAWASLGKLSAIREAALAREMHEAGAEGMGWLYMGFYIHSCQKMRYKGEYSPSYLLDPGTNVFHSLESVTPLLDIHPSGYHPFTSPPTSSATTTSPPQPPPTTTSKPKRKFKLRSSFPTNPPPPSFLLPSSIPLSSINNLLVFLGNRLVLFEAVPFRRPEEVREIVRELVAALGEGVLASAERFPKGEGEAANVFLSF